MFHIWVAITMLTFRRRRLAVDLSELPSAPTRIEYLINRSSYRLVAIRSAKIAVFLFRMIDNEGLQSFISEALCANKL